MDTDNNNRVWEDSMQSLGSRSNYKDVWNSQAEDPAIAKLAVAGYEDEAMLEATAQDTLSILRNTTGYGPSDLILEIGCGVGRVGKVLSKECLHWFGCDISGAMLGHAAKRLADRPNVTLVELSDVGLAEFPDNSLDLVYSTVVFMHLFEWDRFRYVQEMFRVLRPGGRCYYDNMDITSEPGWQMFMDGARYPIARRPAHMSMVSSGEELETYARRAGFTGIRVHRLPQGWVAISAEKPVV